MHQQAFCLHFVHANWLNCRWGRHNYLHLSVSCSVQPKLHNFPIYGQNLRLSEMDLQLTMKKVWWKRPPVKCFLTQDENPTAVSKREPPSRCRGTSCLRRCCILDGWRCRYCSLRSPSCSWLASPESVQVWRSRRGHPARRIECRRLKSWNRSYASGFCEMSWQNAITRYFLRFQDTNE